MSVEFWKSIFDWAAVVLVGLTFIAGAGALITGKILNDRQSSDLQEMNADLARAKTDLAHAQKDASDAQAGNKELGIKLAEAQGKTIEREEELAKEQSKTAEAQRQTAEVQIALRKAAEAAATPRRIIMGNRNGDEASRKEKFRQLQEYRDTPAIVLFVANDEAETLAGDIATVLVTRGGWKSVSLRSLASTPIPAGFVQPGVQIRTLYPSKPTDFTVPPQGATPPSVVNSLIEALGLDLNPPNGAIGGVDWEPDGIIDGTHPTGLSAYGFKIPENAVVITVGRSPTERYFWGIRGLQGPAWAIKQAR